MSTSETPCKFEIGVSRHPAVRCRHCLDRISPGRTGEGTAINTGNGANMIMCPKPPSEVSGCHGSAKCLVVARLADKAIRLFDVGRRRGGAEPHTVHFPSNSRRFILAISILLIHAWPNTSLALVRPTKLEVLIYDKERRKKNKCYFQ